MLHRHRHFIFLIALYMGAVLLQQSVLPILEGTDETLHYNYVTWLQVQGRLPDRASASTNSIQQESGQPPLTYGVAALLLDLLKVPPYLGNPLTDMKEARNFWFDHVDQGRRSDNLNLYLHGNGEQAFAAHPEIITGVRIARLLSLVYGLIAVVGAYGAAREVFRDEKWILTGTAVFAFVPQFIYMSSVLSNDITATAFATLTIWQTLRILRSGASPRHLIVLGVLLALSGLSKVNALLIVPGVGLALVLDWHNQKASIRALVLNSLMVAVPFVIIFGPWVAYGMSTFQDPLGLRTHSFQSGELASPAQVLSALPQIYLSYWAKLSTGSAWMNPIVYILFTVIVGLALLGLSLGRHQQQEARLAQQVLVLGLMLPGLFAALVYWILTLFSVSFAVAGRLLYPAHAAIAIIITVGLYLLTQRLPRRYQVFPRLITIGVLLPASLILTPVTTLAVYAPPPMLSQEQLPRLAGGPVDFDHTIRFLGYTYVNPAIHEGAAHTITLCWEILRRAERPATFLLKYFDADGKTIGERTSVHGMGHYDATLWQPGNIFCDNVDVTIKGSLQVAQTYNVALALMDGRTLAVDWHATGPDGNPIKLPIILGQVVSPAGDMTRRTNFDGQSVAITFPGLADLEKVAYDHPARSGAVMHLDLLWAVKADVHDNLSQFIHLVGPGVATVLADGTPRAGKYPTWAWTTGEKILDQWQLTLPAGLPSGDYAVKIGFYRRDTGERMPVIQNGQASEERTAELLSFRVE